MPDHVQVQPQIRLRLLATTDLHGHVTDFDYYADTPTTTGSLARCATLIRQNRASATNSLLFDNGDFLQGSPLSDHAMAKAGRVATPHPVIAAMNALHYDASALGNHDLSFGIKLLSDVAACADFPFLCANLAAAQPSVTPLWAKICTPTVMLNRHCSDQYGVLHPIKIGVFGVLPPAVVNWERARLDDSLAAFDLVDTAKSCAQTLYDQGADIVIALTHSGLATPGFPGQGMAAQQVAALENVDVVIAGHTHDVFPHVLSRPSFDSDPTIDALRGTVHGTPLVLAGATGAHLGRIDLVLDRDNDGWAVSGHRTKVLSTSRASEDPDISAIAAAAHDATRRHFQTPVGEIATPVNSYFALVSDDLSTRIVADAQADYVRRALVGTPYADLPVLGAAAPSKCGGRAHHEGYVSIPAGPLTQRDIADLQHFPNDIAAVLLSGAAVKDWLEMAAGQYLTVQRGRPDQPLRNDDFPSYNRDFIAGLSFEIDLSQPPRFDLAGQLVRPNAQRVGKLTYRGSSIVRQSRFVIATNNYRACGGGHFPNVATAPQIDLAPMTVRAVLTDYLASRAAVTPVTVPHWRFAPLEGTSVHFHTHHDALAHVGAIPWIDLDPLGAPSVKSSSAPGTLDASGDTVEFRLNLGGANHLASPAGDGYIDGREVGAGKRLANPVRSGRKQP